MSSPQPAQSLPLTLDAANALAAAQAQRLATRAGLRMLIIKGASLEAHGLRPGYVSADVDLLLEDRTAADTLVAALREQGWTLRGVSFGDRLMTTHSTTLLQDGWPNDLDVHWEFPGLPTRGGAAFARLWSNRLPLSRAGVPCWIPDRYGSMVIWALHSLRGTHQQPRHRDELSQLVSDVLPQLAPSERTALRACVLALGSGQVLKDVPGFDDLLADVAVPTDPLLAESWQRKVAQVDDLTPWFQVLRDAPPLERPRVLLRGVWPTADDLRVLVPGLPDTPLGRLRARWLRMVKLAKRALARVIGTTNKNPG